ncbi:two-component system, response regulator YesN [Evansella caseinilytica]|uniref:Two-component system, response regulator YesN n=1 Tax=Evansella caseinilytica TaxID=1503961 RepID=A0A1H3GHN4_9BACI|nr:response regulator [Evansella caseinilytica]SDY02882.1 two-component system, response regulator YesN [Evansella caseinilytica]
MFKVLIVDDEPMERKGLRKIISDTSLPIVIEEADNGRSAIFKAEEFRPDIVFMDIKMPGIDGVEAAKEIKKMNRFVHIFMVTAFDTFEYARQVMKIGIKDYILKPSTTEEIIEPLTTALHEIELDREKRAEEIILRDNYRRALSIVQSKVITSMLVDDSMDDNVIELELEENFQKESFVMVFAFQSIQPEPADDQQKRKRFISAVQSELLHYYPNHYVGEESMGQFPVLIQLPAKNDNHNKNVKERMMTCGNQIISKVRKLYPDYQLSLGIGQIYQEIDQFVHSYHEALFALSSLKQPNQCRHYNQHLKEKTEMNQVNYPYQLEKKLLETVTAGLVDGVSPQFTNYLQALVAYCEAHGEAVEEKLSEFFILLSRQIIDCGISMSINRKFAETNTMKHIQDELIRISRHIHKMYYAQNRDVVLIAKNYLADHYNKTLTLEEVADVVQLSPQYFSKVFKSRAGSSFIDYLTELRVEKAKELIRTNEKSVKEICFEVGYKDPNYFSRVFKKYTGFSPSEFRHS